MFHNSIRFDLSDSLIHFFRNLDLTRDDCPPIPEHFGFGNIFEDTTLSSIFLLRSAIRHGCLWVTWSIRGGKRTIYGPNPAVCFSEMPLAAFLETSQIREQKGQAISSYALIFRKKSLFEHGARPVIYGLSSDSYSLPKGDNACPRIMLSTDLPEIEQYRYVTFNLSGDKTIDWSHEREWRWPYRGSMAKIENEIKEYGIIGDIDDIPGLNFYQNKFQGMGVIVKSEEEAKRISFDILSLVDRKSISEDHYEYILIRDLYPDYKTLRDPKEIEEAIKKSTISFDKYLNISNDIINKYTDEFRELVKQIENESGTDEDGELGGCWLWLLDNTHILTRSLLYSDSIIISNDRRYLAPLYEFSDGRSLRQRENMTKKLAKVVSDKYGIECCYFSVLNSDDPNDVPFYCDNHSDNKMFYNYA